MWMTSCIGSARGGFWGFWRKSENWVLPSEEEGWLSLACRSQDSGLLSGAPHVRGTDWKASIERLCLSPYVEKPFNSKVIKSFVPELRSRKCFSCFGIPMFYVYIYYEHSTYVSHISASWVCYSSSNVSMVQMSKIFLFQAIQFNQTIQFSISMLLALSNP